MSDLPVIYKNGCFITMLVKVKATKHGRPWKLIYTEKFNSYNEVRKRERYFKTGGGRRKIKKIFEDLNLQ